MDKFSLTDAKKANGGWPIGLSFLVNVRLAHRRPGHPKRYPN
jgi:hypothetical protein